MGVLGTISRLSTEVFEALKNNKKVNRVGFIVNLWKSRWFPSQVV